MQTASLSITIRCDTHRHKFSSPAINKNIPSPPNIVTNKPRTRWAGRVARTEEDEKAIQGYKYLIRQTAQSVTDNHLSLWTLLRVSISTRSSSGRCVQRQTNTANYIRVTCTFLTEFPVFVCVCIPLPDDNLVEVETCTRNISDELLFIVYCAFRWIKWCIIYLIHVMWITIGVQDVCGKT